MLHFGTSAFLKLVCLNDRPQRTELRNRLTSAGGGYDYHRSLRLRVQRHLVGGESIESITGSINEIARPAERNSVSVGLERLGKWRIRHPGRIVAFQAATYESPGGLFRVVYTPDFGIRIGDRDVAVHVWNTLRPPLLPNMTFSVLSLFKPVYGDTSNVPGDLAVLSLPDSRFHRLSEAGALSGVAPALVARIENTMREVSDELGLPQPEYLPEPRP